MAGANVSSLILLDSTLSSLKTPKESEMFSKCDFEARRGGRHTVGYLVSGVLGESHCFPLKEALLSLQGL